MISRLLALALLLTSFAANSQNYIGFGYSQNFSHSLLDQTKMLTGSRIDLAFPAQVGKKAMVDMAIRLNNYGYRDFKVLDSYDQIDQRFTALEAALVFKTLAGKDKAKNRFYMGFGGKLGYITRATSEYYPDSTDLSGLDYIVNYGRLDSAWRNVNRFRVGLIVDMGVNIAVKKSGIVSLGVSYEYDFRNTFDETYGILPEDNNGLGIVSLNLRFLIKP